MTIETSENLNHPHPASSQPEPEVVGPPDWRGMCEELVNELQGYASANPYHDSDALVARARAALAAEPVAEGPPDEELLKLAAEALEYERIPYAAEGGAVEAYHYELLNFARAVLARYGHQPAPVPVAVSERLPGPEDCDAEGRCWWGEPQIGDSHDATWSLCTQDDAEEFLTWGTKCGWLPATALPVPGQGEI